MSIGLFMTNPVFQIFGVLALNKVVMMYYGSVRPLTNRFDNRLEIFNEYFVSICCMHLFFFTDEIDVEYQQIYGWSLVYSVGTMCTVNLLVMFYELGRYVMLLVTRTYYKVFPPPKEPV